MNNQTILSTFESFIDDTLDQSIEISLAEQARYELEIELKLQASTKLDTSQTSQVGGTYITPYPLVSDILVPKGTIIYVGTDQYIGIPFQDREFYKGIPFRWYADLNGGNFYLTGTQALAQTITFPYITKGTAIDATTATSLKWPDGTHILIPMQMAKMWFAIDQGDKARAWDDRWEKFFEQTKQQLVKWDQEWKLAMLGASTPYGAEAPMQEENRINLNR